MKRSFNAAALFIAAACLAVACCLELSARLAAEEAPKTDPRYPFRTDFANAHLPWYEPKPGEFPPHHSDRRISGELVSADFIHRTGQFRTSKTGELVDFTMPPYGAINYLNAEADLRDVPLGTYFLFFLNQDAQGGFTRLATMQDQFSIDAGHSFSYRLDTLKLDDKKLLLTKHSIPKNLPDLGKSELRVTDETRVWKGDQPAKLADLAVGDELLFNLTGKSATSPGQATDLWVGVETHQLATDKQRKKQFGFVKDRGLPGWIERTEGKKVTVTLFSGDPKKFKEAWLSNFGIGKETTLVVATDELRTWNPRSDKDRGKLLEIQDAPTDGYGCSGVRMVVTMTNMLEGFRKGRVVRVFGTDWPLKEQFYGESLMNYGYSRPRNSELWELAPKEYPSQFPYRTDYGNAHLSWYQLQSDVTPPQFSEHLVFGAFVNFDAQFRSGQFRADRTGKLCDFTLIPTGAVQYLNAAASLADMPPGTRCRFHLYQDEHGEFTRASLVTDEFSYLAANFITYRVDAIKLDASKSGDGKLLVARQIPEAKNYNGDMEQPPDIGRSELRIHADTRFWKGEQSAQLADLAVGDLLVVNLTGELPDNPSRCTDIWIGVDTHRLVAKQQATKFKLVKRKK